MYIGSIKINNVLHFTGYGFMTLTNTCPGSVSIAIQRIQSMRIDVTKFLQGKNNKNQTNKFIWIFDNLLKQNYLSHEMW